MAMDLLYCLARLIRIFLNENLNYFDEIIFMKSKKAMTEELRSSCSAVPRENCVKLYGP